MITFLNSVIILVLMQDKTQLNTLWGLIKDKKNIFAGEYEGLKYVAFNLDMSSFKKSYEEKQVSHNTKEVKVVESLDDAINILLKSSIVFHHLTCAANTGYHDDTALCIHYDENGTNKSIAIPGVNYVPSGKTKEYVMQQKKFEELEKRMREYETIN